MTTTEQSHQIMAALATNVDWTKVRFEGAKLQESLIRDPARAAQQFTTFLNNGAQVVIGEPNIITIDYSLTLPQMIVAGRYDWTNSSINSQWFPIVGNGIEAWEWKLVDFGRDISSDDAEHQIAEDDKINPWQPAGTEHVLAFGAQNPEEQRKYPIVALKAVGKVNGVRHVMVLGRDGAGRDLYLRGRGGDWGARYRFLVVRKLKK